MHFQVKKLKVCIFTYATHTGNSLVSSYHYPLSREELLIPPQAVFFFFFLKIYFLQQKGGRNYVMACFEIALS